MRRVEPNACPKRPIPHAAWLVVGLLCLTGLASCRPADADQGRSDVSYPVGDFTLTDQTGKKISLHDFKGKKSVALAFYIFAFTGG